MATFKRSGTVQIKKSAIKQGVLYHEVDQGEPCFACDGCPGFALHFWRKQCTNCGCSKASHGEKAFAARQVGRLTLVSEIERKVREHQAAEERAAEELRARKKKVKKKKSIELPSIPTDQFDEDQYAALEELRRQYAWLPDGLTPPQIEQYFATIPPEKVPRNGTPGVLYRAQQLERQLPAYDIDPESCSALFSEEEKATFQEFAQLKLNIAADLGRVVELTKKTNCYLCGGKLGSGDLAVTTERITDKGKPVYFHHDTCFMCEVCEEPLVDLFCFVLEEQRLLCGRHWSDQYKPRCNACDETIVAEDLTFAEDANWHLNHFCCYYCDVLLAEKEYVASHGQPYCLDCYEAEIAEKCSTCGLAIEASSGRISDGKPDGKVWHARCFACHKCKENLEGRACYPKNDSLYCRTCYHEVFKKVRRKSRRSKIKKTPGGPAPAAPPPSSK